MKRVEIEANKESLAVAAENAALWGKAAQHLLSGEKMLMVYNNFFANLLHPKNEGGIGGNIRALIERQNKMDAKKAEENEPLASERAKRVTWRGFFEDLDSIIKELRKEEELNRLYTEYLEADKDDRLASFQALERALEPVYIKMRLLGYSKQDLIQ